MPDDPIPSEIPDLNGVPLSQIKRNGGSAADKIVRRVLPEVSLSGRPPVAAFNSSMPPQSA